MTLSQNCSTTVMQALVAGRANSVLTPREVDNWESIIIWTPADVEVAAQRVLEVLG